MTDCGQVTLLPSHKCFNIIMLSYDKPLEWPTSIKQPLAGTLKVAA